MSNRPAINPIESIDFVFSECARFQSEVLSKEQVVPNSPEAMEFFYRIPHPTVSWSFMVCGRAADIRLRQLADRACSQAGISHQVATKLVRDKLAEVIVRKFIREKRPIDQKNVDRALSEAAKLAGRERKTVTHYVPCHLMFAQKPDEFRIGPVRFLPQGIFRQEISCKLRANRKKLAKSRIFVGRTLKYYKSFRWVAEITVPSSDKETSKETAIRTVSAALDCLHLLLEPRYTYKMCVGGPNLETDWRGSLSVTSDGGLSYSTGFTGAGSVAFEDDWFRRFEHSFYAQALLLCGVALESTLDPSFRRPLSTRFLDAALWFGEAVRETSTAAKVVKYATALERMLMTDEQDDITGLMSQRVAALCCEDPNESFTNWQADARKLYSLRSKLVHGSLSPHSAAVLEGVSLGAKIGEAALLHTLLAFGEAGLKDESASRKRLAHWFNSVVSRVLSDRSDTASTELAGAD
jgi:hypothetical protein